MCFEIFTCINVFFMYAYPKLRDKHKQTEKKKEKENSSRLKRVPCPNHYNAKRGENLPQIQSCGKSYN